MASNVWIARLKTHRQKVNSGLQVIEGVARSMSSEIGENSSVRVNGGDLVYQ